MSSNFEDSLFSLTKSNSLFSKTKRTVPHFSTFGSKQKQMCVFFFQKRFWGKFWDRIMNFVCLFAQALYVVIDFWPHKYNFIIKRFYEITICHKFFQSFCPSIKYFNLRKKLTKIIINQNIWDKWWIQPNKCNFVVSEWPKNCSFAKFQVPLKTKLFN